MDSQGVLDYSKGVFTHYSTGEEAREKFLFAKALQNNEQLCEDVKREFFARVEEVCGDDNHQQQKRAFRKTLLENIKNMVMWQEYFKREAGEESQMIYSFLKTSFKDISHDEFERQSAYFQLYSEAMYSMLQSILNRYYDESIDNNYSVMLVKVWRVYFEHYFNSIVSKAQGKEFPDDGSQAKLNEMLKKVEASALQGDDLVYDLNSI
jgi:hypothetical protein